MRNSCVRDLIRAWALFCVALGAMGLSVPYGEQHWQKKAMAVTPLRPNSNSKQTASFLLVGLISMLWDWHLMKSKHWEAEHFLLVNLAANAAISTAAASAIICYRAGNE